MSRPPRVHVPGGCYHVTLRGNHRQPIFRTDRDREDFSELLAAALQRFGARAHAYCWMTNHIHLLAQVGDPPLGCVVHSVASRYARRFQHAVPTTGHLFERRYHASLLPSDDYLLDAVRYIHRNPVEAGIVTDPKDYRWSSHATYVRGGGPHWLTTRFVLNSFAADEATARRAYATFMQSASGAEHELAAEFDGRGARTAGESAESTDTGTTTRNLDLPLERCEVEAVHLRPASLDALIARTCDRAGLSPDLLTSPSRIPRLSALRAAIAAEALRAHVATLTEIAVRFERNVASISRLVQRHVARSSADHIRNNQLGVRKTKAKPGT